MIEAVIFDKDGTLFGFQETWGAMGRDTVRILSEGDNQLAARVADALGYDDKNFFRPDSVVIAGSTADVVAALSNVLPERDDLARVLDEIATGVKQVPVEGLLPTLETLSQRYRLGVVTNDTEVPALTHLAQAGIARFFAFVAGYDSGFGQKPDPGQLLAFCETVGVPPRETLMVGDSLHDLSAAKSAGMPAVAVLTGVAVEAELAPHAEAVLPSIAALPDWLAKRRSG